MNEPLVCAVLLTKDRPEMAARAVRAFRAQTYQRKKLLVFDTGKVTERSIFSDFDSGEAELSAHGFEGLDEESIGELRNRAIELDGSDIIVTWDDDDVSHPNRIAEQVAQLQASGADVVGYNEMLFWREGDAIRNLDKDHTTQAISDAGGQDGKLPKSGEAWLYKAPRGTAPGTSLCYWRKTWERKPFLDMPNPVTKGTGEDVEWLKGLSLATESGICSPVDELTKRVLIVPPWGPRLIASIHGGNTMSYDLEEIIRRGSREWKLAPEWDAYCRERVVL